MDSPPPWSYAGRAAYFGDRVCAFCDHHNPAAAKFCNTCGSPLHLRPCNQCDAVNDQSASNCHKCGAECAPLSSTHGTRPVLPDADPPSPPAAPGEVGVAPTVTQPALRSGWRSFWPAQFLLASIATILIAAGEYVSYRINAARPDAIGVAQPIGAGERNEPTSASAVALGVESKSAESETTAELQAVTPASKPEAPKRASARQRPTPVPATKGASTHQHPVPKARASVAATASVKKSPPIPPVGAPVAQARKAPPQHDPWEAMHVSLAQCAGGAIARMACDQRVRRRYCEGHWGEAPECAGLSNDRGQ